MTATLIGLAGLIILLLMRVPLGFAMLIIGFLGTSTVRGMDAALMGVSTTIFEIAISPAFVVLPLFMLMGSLVSQARLSDDLYDTANAWMGHLKGGLAMSTVAASGGFAAVTGNSVATVVTMAKVALPSMRRYKYGDSLAAGTIAAGGTLGILIPPSNALIIYGLLTETDVGKLFIAGIIPGIMTIFLYIIVVQAIVTVKPQLGPRGERSDWKTRIKSLSGVWGVLALFFLIMGGISLGIFTPRCLAWRCRRLRSSPICCWTETHVLARPFRLSLFDAGKTTAMLFSVLFGALVLNQFILLTGVGGQLSDFVTGLKASPQISIFAILGILIILGMFVEGMAMILLVVPIFVPIVEAMGFDLIWFGVFLVVAVELSLVTPPVGLNAFVLKAMMKRVELSTIFAGIIPFYLADITRLVLLILFPMLALWLPGMMV